jgi:putative FmdB family regulatory protein
VPTYQYACTECGHTFEQFQSFTDDALGHCPECGGRLRKVFNAVGVVFKGSGFYRTDSRADAKAGSAKSDSSSEKPGAATGAAAKDSSGSTGDSSAKSSKDGSSASSSKSSSDSSSSSSTKSTSSKSSSD